MMADERIEAVVLLDELIAAESSRFFYGISAGLWAKLKTIRLTLTRPAPKADSALVGELRGLLEGTSPGPWAYRPDEFDDWGVVRGPEKTVEWADYPVRPFVAQARHSDMQGEEYLAECRKAKTDPWAGDAKLIVWMRNHADTILTALSDRDVVLEEAAKDKERLDWLQSEMFDVRWVSGAGDQMCSPSDEVGVHIVSHWMAEPKERVEAENWNEDLRAVIDEARALKGSVDE